MKRDNRNVDNIKMVEYIKQAIKAVVMADLGVKKIVKIHTMYCRSIF